MSTTGGSAGSKPGRVFSSSKSLGWGRSNQNYGRLCPRTIGCGITRASRLFRALHRYVRPVKQSARIRHHTPCPRL